MISPRETCGTYMLAERCHIRPLYKRASKDTIFKVSHAGSSFQRHVASTNRSPDNCFAWMNRYCELAPCDAETYLPTWRQWRWRSHLTGGEDITTSSWHLRRRSDNSFASIEIHRNKRLLEILQFIWTKCRVLFAYKHSQTLTDFQMPTQKFNRRYLWTGMGIIRWSFRDELLSQYLDCCNSAFSTNDLADTIKTEQTLKNNFSKNHYNHNKYVCRNLSYKTTFY